MLLDTSYSMGYGDRWAARAWPPRATPCAAWARATAARSCCSRRAPTSPLRSTAEVSALDGAIDAAKPGSGATRYAPALKVAGSLLAESQLPRREVVLISDFQRTGWRGAEGTSLPAGRGR